ncbi:MAG TPA: glycosyltransferase family 39 protein [Candidatus Omnitrophota bacterium]|nr:glycosyltransferase family 39 protein [Candidatus Omnitrophota bacterium]HPT39101.1 glycosyltransferase family 39 protein [Candidatus Omnitrophota bacterium]
MKYLNLERLNCSIRKRLSAEGAFLLLIIAVALALRTYQLAKYDLWYDEIISFYSARDFFHPTHQKFIEPPLFYFLLHYWIKIFPANEFWLRLPSVIIGVFTVIATFNFKKIITDKKIVYLATALIALSPFHIWYSQEVRHYILSCLLAVLNIYYFLSLLKNKNLAGWLKFSLISILGLYSSYFFILLLCAEFIYSLFKVSFGKIIICYSFILVIYSYWLPSFTKEYLFIKQGFWNTIPTLPLLNLKYVFENFGMGYNCATGVYIFYDLFLIFIFGYIFILKKELLNNPVYRCGFSLLTIGLVISFLFSRSILAIWLDRGLIIFIPLFYLLVSFAILNLKKWAKIFSIAVVLFLLCYALFNYYAQTNLCFLQHRIGVTPKEKIKSAISFLEKSGRPNDLYLISHLSIYPAFSFYNFKYPHYFIFPNGALHDTFKTPFVEKGRFINIETAKAKIKNADNLIWIIGSNWERNDNSQAGQKVIDSFNKDFNRVVNSTNDGFYIHCFRKSTHES